MGSNALPAGITKELFLILIFICWYGYMCFPVGRIAITIYACNIYENEYEEKFFCKACRECISGHTEKGFLLLDLRTPENFSIHSLDIEDIQTVRCYEVHTTQSLDEIEIVVHGTLEIVEHIIQ